MHFLSFLFLKLILESSFSFISVFFLKFKIYNILIFLNKKAIIKSKVIFSKFPFFLNKQNKIKTLFDSFSCWCPSFIEIEFSPIFVHLIPQQQFQRSDLAVCPTLAMLRLSRRLQTPNPCLGTALLQLRFAGTDSGSPSRSRRRSKFPASPMKKVDEKSEWWVVDGEMHEIGDNVPPRERFVIPRDNIPNKRRKQLREQFMRRTRLVLKELVRFFFVWFCSFLLNPLSTVLILLFGFWLSVGEENKMTLV